MVSASLCFYDFISFNSNNCRVVIPDSQVLNDILWYAMRALGYQLWAIPIIYVSWPVSTAALRRKLKKSSSSSIQHNSTNDYFGANTSPYTLGGKVRGTSDSDSILNPLFDKSSNSSSIIASTAYNKDTLYS